MKLAKVFASAILMIAAVGAWAQSPGIAEKSDQILDKVTQLDILNRLLPLVLTKEQYGKILPAVEKARQRVRDTQKKEADELKSLEPKLDTAMKDALDKGKVPTQELLKESSALFNQFRQRRLLVGIENEDAVLKVTKETLNLGQFKAAVNAFSPRLADPTLDPAKLDDDTKLRLFVRTILLHPGAYDLLLKLSKKG